MSDDVIRIKTRVKYQGAWMPWRELANDYSIVNALREKAPDGYGLGSNAKLLTADDDLNTVLTTGWYNWSWAAHPQNAPDNNWHEYGCAMHVFSTTPGGYAIQIVYDLSDDITHGCAIQRTIYVLSSGTVYYPWEWVNPPMSVGVEYRTTERYLGKPVYVKTVNTGALPNATYKEISASFPNANRFLAIYGSAYKDNAHLIPLPCLRYGSDAYNTDQAVQVTVNTTTSITISTNRDMSSFTESSVCVKYTKSTD